MTDDNTVPPTGSMASGGEPAGSLSGRALVVAVLVVAGGVLAGIIGGLVWAAVAPRVQYQVYTLKPPTAYATNPETSAFIAADGMYSFIALGGGAVLGLLSYLFAVRRYRAVPMAGLVIGSVAAAFVAAWLGHWASGGAGFNHVLATSKPGEFLFAPISLGARGALAFWPLGAAAMVGGIELAGTLRARRQLPGDVPMPGIESFGRQAGDHRPDDALRTDSDRRGPQAGSQPDGRHRAGQDHGWWQA